MFPSPNNNPFDHHHFSLFKKPSPFLYDDIDAQSPTNTNSTSKQDLSDHYPPFLFNFPSPIFDDHDLPLNQILSQTTNLMPTDKNETFDHEKKPEQITIPVNKPPARTRRNLGAVPRKRTGKKDRHSKICTAQGIRDRRMRLSLQVARKFFDLQDMLGYDKASKTIEWLFTKSKKAIKELMNKDHSINPQGNCNNISMSDAKSESFLSECDQGVSGIDQENSNIDGIKELGILNGANAQKDEIKSRKNKLNTRESREKARARARWRTREKMMIKGMDQISNQCWKLSSNPNFENHILKLGSSSSTPFDQLVDQESMCSLNLERVSVSPPPLVADFHHFSDVGTIEKLLQGNSSSSTNSSSCPNNNTISHDNYNHSSVSAAAAGGGGGDVSAGCNIDGISSINLMGFLGNWDLLNSSDRLSSTHQHYAAVTDQVPIMAADESPNSINYSNYISNYH